MHDSSNSLLIQILCVLAAHFDFGETRRIGEFSPFSCHSILINIIDDIYLFKIIERRRVSAVAFNEWQEMHGSWFAIAILTCIYCEIVGFIDLRILDAFGGIFMRRISVKFSSLVIFFHLCVHMQNSISCCVWVCESFTSSCVIYYWVLQTIESEFLSSKSHLNSLCVCWTRVLLAAMITEKIINFFKARKHPDDEWERRKHEKKTIFLLIIKEKHKLRSNITGNCWEIFSLLPHYISQQLHFNAFRLKWKCEKLFFKNKVISH